MRRLLTASIAALSMLTLPRCLIIDIHGAAVPAPAAAEVKTIEVFKEVRVTPTPNLALRYTLKEGVEPEQFKTWVHTTDQPSMRSLARVKDFRTYRAERLLMGEGKPAVA